jgi:hypothetical protein
MYKYKMIDHYIQDMKMRVEPSDPELYNEIKKNVHEELPVHSLYRSALIHNIYHNMIGGSMKADTFMKQLEKLKISRNEYLSHAKMMALSRGYNPDLLSFAEDNNHKLKYESPKGIVRFGKANYGDYIIYQFMEKMGDVERGFAKKKRRVFRASHSEISRIHHLDKYSPNEMSINVIW